MEPKSLDKIQKKTISQWFQANAQNPKSLKYLNVLTFTESSFFPIPPDPFMALLVVARPEKWISISFQTTVFSVLGGVFGYAIGYFLFDILGVPIINFFNLHEQAEYLSQLFNQNAFLAMFIAAFTPVPYKIFTIMAGLFQINIFIFIVASFVGRGLRFFILGFLMKHLGEKFAPRIFENLNKILIVLTIFVLIYIWIH